MYVHVCIKLNVLAYTHVDFQMIPFIIYIFIYVCVDLQRATKRVMLTLFLQE